MDDFVREYFRLRKLGAKPFSACLYAVSQNAYAMWYDEYHGKLFP